MTTKDFIKHHTRLILEAEKDAPPEPAKSAEPTKSAEPEKKEKAASLSDFHGKYAKIRRTGRISNVAKEALGLATTNPSQLLQRLGLSGYKTTGKTKNDEIKNFIIRILQTNREMGLAFNTPEMSGDVINIPLASIGGGFTAIKEPQSPRYIRASIIAGDAIGLISFDGANKIQLFSTEKDSNGKQEHFVKITM